MNEARHNLQRLEIGGGRVEGDEGWHLILPPGRQDYANAQIDDHRDLAREAFHWKPPLSLELEARAHPARPRGTLGFGFWNDPFAFNLGQAGAARRLPASPQAVWFFYGSSPNDLSFTAGVPGHGWKAVSLRTPHIPSIALALPAAAAAILSALPLIRRPVIGLARAFVTSAEQPLDVPLDEWHRYRIEWDLRGAEFWLDGDLVLTAPSPPDGPLGLVAWIDNQYAAVSPKTGLRFGVLPTQGEQRLEIRDLTLNNRLSD